MKGWQKALSDIRFCGPDVESFREDVELIWDHITALEDVANHVRKADHVYRELDNNKYLSDQRLDELHIKALAILRHAHEKAQEIQ